MSKEDTVGFVDNLPDPGTGALAGFPMSRAARLELVRILLHGEPIYCDCDRDCHVILGYTAPLITTAEAIRMLDFTQIDDVAPISQQHEGDKRGEF